QRWQDGAAVEYFSGGAASLSVGFPSPLTLLSPPQPLRGEGLGGEVSHFSILCIWSPSVFQDNV
ncbi:MAG TPA: hypothetical protein VK003_11235, partial [Oceanobacillus sp.]|nr:hypothetical protein [Oceanobacillus sp.]